MLRAWQRWLLPGIALLLLFLTFSSTLSPYSPRSLQQAWQLGHVVLFALLAWLALPPLQGRCPGPRALVGLILVLALAGGLLIEYLQGFIGREASLLDLAFDLAGAGLGLCLHAARGHLALPLGLRRLLFFPSLGVCLLGLVPLGIYLVDELNMRRNVPVLADFDGVLEAGRFKGEVERVRLISAKGEHNVLRIALDRGRYSGTSSSYFFRDWRGYARLALHLYNPDPLPLQVTLRVHDESHYARGGDYHDRFNRRLLLDPGWNRVLLPLAEIQVAPRERQMAMDRIQGLMLFSSNLPGPRAIYLDRLELE